MQIKPSLKWNVNKKSIDRITNRYATSNIKNIKRAIGRAAEAGASAVRNDAILRGSPTDSAWHYFANLIRGNDYGARKDTGRMLNSVGSSQGVRDGVFGTIAASYGLPVDGPKYFMEQDQGYTFTTWSGREQNVPGMNSFQKSLPAMTKNLRKEMLRYGFLTTGSRQAPRQRKVLNRVMAGYDFDSAWGAEFPTSPARIQAGQEMAERRRQKQQEAVERGMNSLFRFTEFLERTKGISEAQRYYRGLEGN